MDAIRKGKQTAEYYLMHKDIPVCLMEISDDGSLKKVRKNKTAEEHFPLGGRMNNERFHEWWRDRAIPKSRHGVKTALQKLGYASTGSALVNNLALSLSDCYWICPRGESLSWNDVSLFSNDFVDTFGDITINQHHTIDLRNKTRFNCAASQGELQKKWCIDNDGHRYMIKGNYGNSFQQSLNEVFATSLHKQQNFRNYTSYSLVKLQVEDNTEGLGCMCYDFCSENLESISAWEMLQTIKVKQNESWYYAFKKVCLELGMPEQEFTDFIDYQIMSDYLISNTDRHMNNIAVIRNPDTLELLGFAPIFDSGNSMFYNLTLEQLSKVKLSEITTHSFLQKENRLLQYVRNRSLVDTKKARMDFDICENDIAERHERIPLIKALYNKKLASLSAFQAGKDIWKKY